MRTGATCDRVWVWAYSVAPGRPTSAAGPRTRWAWRCPCHPAGGDGLPAAAEALGSALKAHNPAAVVLQRRPT